MAVSLKENNWIFLLWIKLHALIRLGVSPSSFDTGALHFLRTRLWAKRRILSIFRLQQNIRRLRHFRHRRADHDTDRDHRPGANPTKSYKY
jgi:hypothetical protein